MMDELADELERRPRPAAPAELRERVLSAVSRELVNHKRRVPRWERAAEIAVAASLVLGVGMNVWQWRAQSPRFDRNAVSRMVNSNRLASIGRLDDREVDEAIRRHYTALTRSRQRSSSMLAQRYQELLNEWISSNSRPGAKL
jgi:hypothetical protein